MDLTAVRGKDGRRYWILGLIEYRSRALLVLAALPRKTAAAIGRILIEAFRRFGTPGTLITDNEGPFRSRVWKRLLARFHVLHRRIEPYCPWQNGRIERFFGTLKRKLGQRRAADPAELQSELNVFRYWYNHIRPHQALYAAVRCGTRALRLCLTPAEAWLDRGDREHGSPFEGWEGRLRGWSCRI
jgi:transposase InsO family protein